MTDKKALREEMRRRKCAMTEAEIAGYSRELTERFCATEEYRKAKSVYAYLSFNQEVRTAELCTRAKADGKRVAVPKCYGDKMVFLWIDDLTQVAPSAFGVPEPVFDAPEADDPQALILMPGVAFDAEGHRVGYGGGYYDRYLASHPGHTCIALCYPFQMLEHIETAAHDIPVDRVIAAEGRYL